MNKLNKTESIDNINITESEKKILRIIRTIDFGEANIIIQNNKPVRIEKIKTSIKL